MLYLGNEVGILSLALLVLFLDLLLEANSKKFLGYISLIGILFLAYYNLKLNPSAHEILFNGMFIFDSLAQFFKEIFYIITFIVILISLDYFEKHFKKRGEYFSIILFILLGMNLLASSNELITLFVSLELISIPLYILASFNRNDQKSAEAGLKYFLLGALSSGILLYGMSLIYGTLQTTFLTNILLKLSKLEEFPLALILGLIFILGGLGFKIASAPFHMWAPDVYQGAPTPITAFISIGPKAAGIAVLIRLLLGYFITLKPDWTFILSILSIFSMTIGNLAALSQTNFKRMLAYSGIAQIGYILIGLTSASVSGLSGILFYILIYALTNLGAFSIIIIYALETGSEEIKDYAGLVKRSPLLASILFLALLSLAGIPPLSGFIGKFYIFTSAVQSKLYFLAFMGIINSVISLFYYLSVLKYVFFEKPLEDTPLKVNFSFKLALSLALIGIVFLGLYPPLMESIEEISKAFLLFKVF